MRKDFFKNFSAERNETGEMKIKRPHWGEIHCDICSHWVRDMAKHEQSVEHRQKLKRIRRTNGPYHQVRVGTGRVVRIR